jgi:HlyD family secretion protein
VILRRYAVYGIVIVVAIAGFSAVARKGKVKPPKDKPDAGISVVVSTAHTGSMPSIVEVSGDIKALKTALLSAKISGRVISVPRREGDRVSAGAVVVQQDTSDLSAQAQQADAALSGAQARLSQAITSAGVSGPQIESQIAQAKAGLDSAKARLRMVKAGARTQERAQAQNAVVQAKANYDNAKADLERMRSMHEQGAISPRQWDTAQTQYQLAAAQYDSAKQQLSLIEAGAREEEIESAEKAVVQAEEALHFAESNRSQKALREEDVKSAKAGVVQAKAALAYARQQLANASIRTPIAGTVSQRVTEPGQMASPGVPLIEVVALDSVYFEATVSEMDVDRVRTGQPVQVEVDALPGRKFQGTVQKILPTADPKSRQFTARIAVPNRAGDLRPGMFARGSIEVARHRNVVIIPKDALISNGTGQAVYILRGSAAKLAPVITRFESREEAEVTGVSAGEQLVVVGQDKLSDGVKVHVAN